MLFNLANFENLTTHSLHVKLIRQFHENQIPASACIIYSRRTK